MSRTNRDFGKLSLRNDIAELMRPRSVEPSMESARFFTGTSRPFLFTFASETSYHSPSGTFEL